MVMAGLAMLLAAFAYAEAEVGRSYAYDAIVQAYVVDEDSTVDVTEAQTFDYIEQFYSGRRRVQIE